MALALEAQAVIADLAIAAVLLALFVWSFAQAGGRSACRVFGHRPDVESDTHEVCERCGEAMWYE